MTNWDEEIELSDLRKAYEDEGLDYDVFRNAVADRLSKSRWAREEEDVRELIEDLRRAETPDEYDDEIEYIYDRADRDNVWLGF